jgi:hypothetical protein
MQNHLIPRQIFHPHSFPDAESWEIMQDRHSVESNLYERTLCHSFMKENKSPTQQLKYNFVVVVR